MATQANKIPDSESSALGENVNIVDVKEGKGEGSTTLHRVAVLGQTKIIRELLQKGADVNALDASGKTPLDYAVGHQKAEYVLRKAGGKKAKELFQAEIASESLADGGKDGARIEKDTKKSDDSGYFASQSPEKLKTLEQIPSRAPTQQMHDRNDLLQAIVKSFADYPDAILRYACFDNTNDLVNIYLALQEMKKHTGQPSTDFLVDATGSIPQHKESSAQEALAMVENILAGTSGNYKTVTLLINDWDRRVLGRIKDRFLGKGPILGWVWAGKGGLIEAFEYCISSIYEMDGQLFLPEHLSLITPEVVIEKTKVAYWEELKENGRKLLLTKEPRYAVVYSFFEDHLEGITVSAKYPTPFLGVNSGDPERILLSYGYRIKMKVKPTAAPDTWVELYLTKEAMNNHYVMVSRNESNRFVELTYCTEQIDAELIQILQKYYYVETM